MIGSLGDVAFVTSSNLVRTFHDLTRNVEARYAEHDVIGRKPSLHFLGAALDEVSLSIRLDRMLGAQPLTEMQRLATYVAAGEVLPLFIGDEALGSYVIRTMSEARRVHNAHGDLLLAEVTLSLTEYVE